MLTRCCISIVFNQTSFWICAGFFSPQVRIQYLTKGAAAHEAENCRCSKAESRGWSGPFSAGVQSPLNGPGSGCKTQTLGSFSNALLITSISYKSENQVVHEQKFKDPLNGTSQFSSVG